MATSGDYTFTFSRDHAIRIAMMNIGKLDEIESPSPQDITDCTLVLNMIVKQMMDQTEYKTGLGVYKRKWGYLFLSNSTGKYTVGPGSTTGWTNSFVRPLTTAASASGTNTITVDSATGIAATYYIGIELSSGALYWTTVASVASLVITLDDNLSGAVNSGAQVYCFQTIAQQPLYIETAVLRDSDDEDIPLNILKTVQDYANLPSKTDTQNISDPTAIYYEYQLTNSNLYTDCGASNDVTKYLVLSYTEPVQVMSNAADDFEFPMEFFMPITWALSKQIAPMYSMPWTQTMESNYVTAMMLAKKKDAETTTEFFQPGEE